MNSFQNIIPKVNGSVKELEGVFVMPEVYRTEGGFERADKVFAERMERLGSYSFSKEGKPVIFFGADPSMEAEAYRIHVGEDRIDLTASGQRGYTLALASVYQMLAQGKGSIPCCEAADHPRYEHRGLMLDCCRHFFPAQEVKKIIEQMSLLKMNSFHWHLGDDQGFRIESKVFPGLNTVGSWRKLSPQDPMVEEGRAKALDTYGGYYSQEEIRDVVQFAADRGVDVVPEIDLPGHASAILAAYPQYTCTGEPLKVRNTFGVHERIFCAGKEEAYTFLEKLLDEIMSLFPSRYIHLGGDEAPKAEWHKCPDCSRVMKAMGFTDYEQLQAYFTGRLVDFVKTRGKTAIVWNESAASGMLDGTAVVQYWSEMAPGASYMVPEIRKGRKLILSDGDCLYIGTDYASLPLKAALMYEPNVKGTPVPQENVLGIEAPVWTEWMCSEEALERSIHPHILAVAELGWTKEKNPEEFLSRVKSYLACAPLNILKPTPFEEATVHGDAAVRQVVMGLLSMGARYAGMTTGEEGEQAGKAEAITPDGAQKIDREAMTRIYITNKMRLAYSQEEIEEAISMVLQITASHSAG